MHETRFVQLMLKLYKTYFVKNMQLPLERESPIAQNPSHKNIARIDGARGGWNLLITNKWFQKTPAQEAKYG